MLFVLGFLFGNMKYLLYISLMFKIYHIIGIKIGITHRDVKTRIREQFKVKEFGYPNFEILEIHNDYNIARDREIELQKQYGYRIDKQKYDLKRLSNIGKKMGPINGKKNKKPDHLLKRKRKLGLPKTPSKPIIIYSVITNDIIGNFNSIKSASRYLNILPGYITNVLTGRIKNPKKYYFQYQ